MRLRIFVVSVFMVGFVSMICAQQTPVPETVTASKAGHVIDVENGRVLEKQIIVAVDGDPIADIRQLEHVTFVS